MSAHTGIIPVPVRRVCVNFQPWRPWLRPVMQGIRQYLQQQRLTWDLVFTQYAPEADPHDLNLAEADGVIGGDINEKHLAALAALPMVMVERHGATDPRLRYVSTDMTAVGRLAAEHLLERGVNAFAAQTIMYDHPAAQQRVDGFCQRLTQAGYTAAVFRGSRCLREQGVSFGDQLANLVEFLQAQPRPLGLFVMDVNQAWRAVLACRRAGLSVPNDVTMICGGNDDILFENLQPTVSGILYDSVRVGYEAARALDALLSGRPVEPQLLIPPLGPIARQSSDFLAITDPDVHAAMQFICEHAGEPVTVSDVAEYVLVSQRTLHRKFAQVLGRTPAAEIRRARVDLAKRLLLTTELPFLRVAMDAGFVSQAQMCRYIKTDTGLTPTQLRYRDRTLVGGT